jgi:hypothetical protein
MRQRLLGVDDYEQHERANADPVESESWSCLRCDDVFIPHPCPSCGSYQIDGARGVSGAPFVLPRLMVQCRACGEEFPAHTSVVDHRTVND